MHIQRWPYLFSKLKWLAPTLAFLLIAAQCGQSALPPLPTTPSRPIITIAILSPTSGELQTFGRHMQNGIFMAFDEWNNNGGLLGHHINWQIFDTQCDFATAQQATQQAIEAGLDFIIGPLCSEAALGAAVMAEQHQVLLISPAATHPLVTVNGQGQTRPSVFRVAAGWAQQGQAAARFARETLQLDRAALLLPINDVYASQTAQAFAQAFSALDGQIVYRAEIQFDQNDLKETLTTIAQAGAEIIYLPASPLEVNHLAGQNQSLAIPWLGSDRWDTPALLKPLSEGHFFASHFWPTTETSQLWAEAYKTAYAVEPDTLAVLGYDAAHLLATAVQQADTFDVEKVITLLETTRFSANTGPISFDAQHNPHKPIPILQINGQEFKLHTVITP